MASLPNCELLSPFGTFRALARNQAPARPSAARTLRWCEPRHYYISELVDVPVSRRCDQVPDNMPRCVFTSKEKIRIGLNAAMQLLRDDFVIVLNDQGAPDVLDIDRHALAIRTVC